MLDSPNTEQMTVEAATVEDALAEISGHFGEDAEIMRAQKVHRGGVGGFFAKEMVQLTARRRRDAAPAPLRPKTRPQTPPQGGGITDVLERMAQSADAGDSDFRTVLQRELATTDQQEQVLALPAAMVEPESSDIGVPAGSTCDEDHFVPPMADDLPKPVAVGPALCSVPEPESELSIPPVEDDSDQTMGPLSASAGSEEDDLDDVAAAAEAEVTVESAPPVIEPIPDVQEVADDADGWWRSAQPVDAPAGMGPIAWSTTALLRLGLPAPIIAAVAGLDDNDDMGWINGIASVVAPHCGPLPQGDVIVVGPHAERLAEPLCLPLIQSGDMAPYAGSFCAMVEDSPEDRKWLEFVRGGRGIHLVIGDEPWQDLLIGEPVAVSWVGETAVADALYLAFTLGSTLGFGTVDGFVSSMVRAQPTDVALAVRRIVGRR
jgi:hypothetical protein